jgi:hypothetical protein
VKSIRRWETLPIDRQIDGPWFVPNREAGDVPTTHIQDPSEDHHNTLYTIYGREGEAEGEGEVLPLAFNDSESLDSNLRTACFHVSEHLTG